MIDELIKVIDQIGNKHRISDREVLNKASRIYEYYYKKKIKPGCSSCNLSILNGLKNLIKFGKIPIVSDPVFESRNSLCKACEHHWDITNQCGKCKCFLYFKNKIPGEQCPVGKWKKV